MINSHLFGEDVSQLEYELGRFAGRSDSDARRPVAEALLSLRLGWLLATKNDAEPAAGFVSEIEVAHFLDETGSPASGHERPVEDLLGPAVGVSRATAEAFCGWLARWSSGEVARVRLPSVAEARRPFADWTPSRWLAGLAPDAEAGTWCGDGFASLRALPVVERTTSWLDRLLRFDAFFLFRCGILELSGRRMPVRTDDIDFNVHYEKDRRYVERYAGALVAARDALRDWDAGTGSRLGLAARLDFEPFDRLRGTSPLDSQRDAVLEAYRAVRKDILERTEETQLAVPTLAEMAFEYFGSNDRDRLLRACARQVERGVDQDGLLPLLRALRQAQSRRGVLSPSARLAGLEEALVEGGRSEDAQWLALDAWYASDSSRARDPGDGPWWRRMLGPASPRPRDILASIYVDLAVLEERRRGRISAFEGIRLVRDT